MQDATFQNISWRISLEFRWKLTLPTLPMHGACVWGYESVVGMCVVCANLFSSSQTVTMQIRALSNGDASARLYGCEHMCFEECGFVELYISHHLWSR